MLAIGVALSASPVVYQTIEKTEFVKVGLVLVFLVVALVAAVNADAWGELDQVVTKAGEFPGELDFALLLGALAFAGAGGTNNLVVSNWIRDKGFGMGKYAPRIVSPISGEEEAAPSGQGYVFKPDHRNMARWRDWWRKANIEQFVTFFLIGAITIIVFSLVARSTVFGGEFDEANFDFIQAEGNALKDIVGAVVRDAVLADRRDLAVRGRARDPRLLSRLVADVLIVGYFQKSERWTESSSISSWSGASSPSAS